MKFSLSKVSLIVTIACIFLVSSSPVTLAHHPLGGQTPSNFFEGFLSGLAHPIIGLDHFAFVVASGLLAVGLGSGFLIPVSFVIATLIGTGIHLQLIDLAFPEVIIASSVLIFGILLTLKNRLAIASNWYTVALATLAIIAGIFHGYAYGEAIVGAEMTPLVAYLMGFAMIQLGIAGLAFRLGKVIQSKSVNVIRFLGLVIGGIGIVFLTKV